MVNHSKQYVWLANFMKLGAAEEAVHLFTESWEDLGPVKAFANLAGALLFCKICHKTECHFLHQLPVLICPLFIA